MGTLFATLEFIERYVKVGIETEIPVMFPGGHATMITKTSGVPAEWNEPLKATGKRIWDAGLPVLDDIHNISYDFEYPKDENLSDEQLQKLATAQYIETMRQLKPGLSMVIMHSQRPARCLNILAPQVVSGKLICLP